MTNDEIEQSGRDAAAAIVNEAKAAGFQFEPTAFDPSRYATTPEGDAITSFTDDVIRQKLIDAEVPGAHVEFDPDEADRAGAFVEDALSEADARAAEDGVESPSADRGKLSLFAAARNA